MQIDSTAEHAPYAPLSTHPRLLAEAIRGADLADSVLARRHVRNSAALGMEDGFIDRGGADAKIRAPARNTPGARNLGRFLDSGVSINVLRLTEHSLRSASGIPRSIDHCDLIQTDYPHFVAITPAVSVFPTWGDFLSILHTLKRRGGF